MPASKKTASRKKATTKKAAAKKGAAPKAATSAIAGDKLKLNFPLDAQKAAAIRRCLAKGKLTVTISKVDLGAGRLGDPWLYD